MQAKSRKSIYVCVMYLSMTPVLFMHLVIARRIEIQGDVQKVTCSSSLNFVDFSANVLIFFPA